MHAKLLSELGNSIYLGLEGFKMSLARQPQVANQLQNLKIKKCHLWLLGAEGIIRVIARSPTRLRQPLCPFQLQ